ncbi:hypothetical protein KVR01_011460 [Diaporthe batatas]|uniref:uncharacterized protein n=1 Tax=Diaporthe batatas TaxID=748121 RepID=UPI001D05028E|nr:uncharacterized protein KVR01_011460 [Diaporthe batatas]KAG8159017.1 hypothetical protein KVR01_011460 [Diaporthe batatas]
MGRWGHTLFGHDDAIRHAIEITKGITQGNNRHFAHILDKVLTASPLPVGSYYAQEYDLIDQLQSDGEEAIVSIAGIFIFLLKPGSVLTVFHQDEVIRQKLDSGKGDELFDKCRTARQDFPDIFGDSQYRPIVLAAIMMEFGATIRQADVAYLRDLVSKMQCNEHATMALDDMGIRGAGQRQVLAALDHYQAGKPRSFVEPSCHCCGKINADIKAEGKTLMKCGGCKNQIAAAWFCDKVRMAGGTLLLSTRTAQWRRHKPNCGTPVGSGLAMFQAYGKNSLGVNMYRGFNV